MTAHSPRPVLQPSLPTLCPLASAVALAAEAGIEERGAVFTRRDAPESRRLVRDNSPHFPVFPEFLGASYLMHYDLLCPRLVQEQLYTTACLLASPRTAAATDEYFTLSGMTDLTTFVTALAGHVAEAARTHAR
ncbi:PaeR7I family type II restriction endonuclease [Roseicella sp. DB1501]|uniref:PaeR7I family type II restriction endonuclease n=1 Tax=Roseicella sp. DB1501 TaxID=2730925 RepID=UPI00266F7DF4|nr:PaeR7I family type II restriction endonuclease [Roseicella sp. DB1501]